MKSELNNRFFLYLCLEDQKKSLEYLLSSSKEEKEDLVESSYKYRLEKLFMDFIKKNKLEDTFSERSLKALESNILLFSAHNLDLINSGIKISKVLSENSINHLFLKGFYLSNFSYQQISDRVMRDIDLLVHPDSLDQTYKVVNEMGFRFKNSKSDSPKGNLLERYDLPVMIDNKGLHLEIHYRIFQQNNTLKCELSNQMLQNPIKKNIGKNILPFASVELNFIHLLYHATKKEFFAPGPLLLKDLRLIINDLNLDYELLKKYITEFGLKKEASLIQEISSDAGNPIFPHKDYLELDIPKEIRCISSDLILKKGIHRSLIPIFNQSSLYSKIKHIFSLFLPNKIKVSGEFQIREASLSIYMYHFLRLKRQIIFSVLEVFNYLFKRNLTNAKQYEKVIKFLED